MSARACHSEFIVARLLYVKPPAPLAPGFKETTDWKEGDGWKIAKPDDVQLRGKWWELYGDPTLNELEEQVAPVPLLRYRGISESVHRLLTYSEPSCGYVWSAALSQAKNQRHGSVCAYVYDLQWSL
jgi:hypothetical protein